MPKQIPSNELDAVLSAAAQFPGGGSIEDITRALPITLPHRTLQRRLAGLVAVKHLIAEGRGRASRYRLPAVTAEIYAVDSIDKAKIYGETYIPISSEAEAIKRAVREPIQRRRPVGVGKSVYHPLEVPQLIEECFQQFLDTATAIHDPFEQAFFAMVHLPYLRPSEYQAWWKTWS